MNDAEIREALRLVEERPNVTAEFTDSVFRAMSRELEGTVPTPSRGRRPARRAPRARWAPSPRPMVALAALLAVIVGAVVLVNVPRAPSALAQLQDARDRFERLPAYHASTAVAANEDSGDPDFETKWETEDWYQDARHWRTTFVSSTTTAGGAAGDVWVMSPELFAEYDSSTNVFAVKPSAEVSGTMQDSSFFFDPSLHWWSTGAEGDRGKPSDRFFDENCTASASELIGRKATKLHCEAAPRDLELWLDDETGMLLRISAFDIVREITSIEFDADFATGIFEIAPPEGAKVRWNGQGEPPPEYVVPIGTEVAARYRLADGRTDGLAIVEMTTQDLWVIVTRCGDSGPACATELLRVDAGTGNVVATLTPPDGSVFGDVSASAADVWVQLGRFSEEQMATPAAYLQRIDTERNALLGEPIETGTDSGGLARSDGVLWSASGRHREVKIGRAESAYHSLARLDLQTGAVSQFDLGADAMGVRTVGDSLWITTMAIRERDPEETDFALVEFDPRSQQVKRRVSIPGWPNSTTADGGRLYTLFAADGSQWQLGVIDAETGTLTSAEVGLPGADIGGMAVGGGYAWIASGADDAVLKVDLSTLQTVGSVATGRQPGSVSSGNGSIWVTHPADGTLARIDIE